MRLLLSVFAHACVARQQNADVSPCALARLFAARKPRAAVVRCPVSMSPAASKEVRERVGGVREKSGETPGSVAGIPECANASVPQRRQPEPPFEIKRACFTARRVRMFIRWRHLSRCRHQDPCRFKSMGKGARLRQGMDAHVYRQRR